MTTRSVSRGPVMRVLRLFHRRFSPVWVFKWSYLKRMSQTREGASDHRAKATIEVISRYDRNKRRDKSATLKSKPSVVLQFNICATTTSVFN